MREKEFLNKKKNNIQVALDDTLSRFHHLAAEAESKGMHIDGEFEVHGDVTVLHANNELIRQITKLGQETDDLIFQLSEIENQLSHLANE